MTNAKGTEKNIEKPVDSDTNDYKELFNTLRNTINTARESYRTNLIQTKELIAQKEEEVRLLRIRQHKLEGAIEASDVSLTAVLPSNNKK